MSVLPGISDDLYTSGLDYVEANNLVSSVSHFDVDLGQMQSLVLEIDLNEAAKLKVDHGVAEINGTELANSVTYEFKGAMKFAVFTFKGCKISLDGNMVVEHKVVDQPLMNSYVNLALYLEKQRRVAAQMNLSFGNGGGVSISGPKMLILGSPRCGKSWVARTLASYGLRTDRQVVLVDLDPKKPHFVCPGALTATPVSDIYNVENVNFGETEATGSNYYHPKQPLVKCFGLEEWESNPELYKRTISELGAVLLQRFDKDIEVANSGLIVDTPPNLTPELVAHIAQTFKINTVLQIDHDQDIKLPDVKRFALPKGYVIDESDQYIRQIQARTIREYFYGIDRLSLSPYTLTCNYADLKVWRPLNVKKDAADQDNASEDKMFLSVEVDSSSINNSILSIPRPKDMTSCRGFVCVLSCDDEKKKCKILLPAPGSSLPSHEFVLTDFRYYE